VSLGTLVLFAITGGLACIFLGVFVGRLLAIKGLTWTLKDAIGIALIGAFIAVLFILFWKEIPAKNEQLIVYMLGQLSGFVGGVISAHYVHKAGEEKLAAAREETTRNLARAVVDQQRERPTGKPGDPVHVEEEDKG
jgi:membrane associated rhomboid family serine protease